MLSFPCVDKWHRLENSYRRMWGIEKETEAPAVFTITSWQKKKNKTNPLHSLHRISFSFVRASFQRLKKMTARVYLELAISLRRSCGVDLVYQKLSGKQGGALKKHSGNIRCCRSDHRV